MSAICGIVQLNHEFLESTDLNSVMSELLPYGKDGSATWTAGRITLGHQMTHVTPESQSEHLPFQDSNTGCVITADARIDNRSELFSILRIPFELQPNLPDASLMLQAYDKWGLDCPQHLLGDFAVAIWDPKEHRCFCFRDIIGAKPFYYQISLGRFIFASDIRAVLNCPGVKRELDLAYVKTYLKYEQFYHSERSFYDGLLKLPPAHALTVHDGQISKWAYWQPEQAPKIRFKQETDYIEMMRELIQQAVTCQLRSAFPIGAHISGGLDSSGVAVMAARALRQQGRKLAASFSWAPFPQPVDYPLQDERALAEEVCQREQIPLYYTALTPDNYNAYILRDITTQPTNTLLFEVGVCPEVAKQGIRVMLSGWGGDELVAFNGRGYFAELFLCGRWWRLAYELKMRGQLHHESVWRIFKSRVLLPLTPDSLLRHWWPNLLNRPESFPPEGLTAEFVAQLHQVDPLPVNSGRYELPWVHQYQLDLLRDGHLTHRLESWVDHGSPFGIEYRYPLLDRRVIEFSLGVPSWLFFKNGWKRYGYRCAMEGILPASAQWNKTKDEPSLLGEDNLQAIGLQLQTCTQTLLNQLIQTQQTRLIEQRYIDLQYLSDRLSNPKKVAQSQDNFNHLLLLSLIT